MRVCTIDIAQQLGMAHGHLLRSMYSICKRNNLHIDRYESSYASKYGQLHKCYRVSVQIYKLLIKTINKKRRRTLQKELLSVGLKMCSRCKDFMNITDFNNATNSSDGLYSSCKHCRSELSKISTSLSQRSIHHNITIMIKRTYHRLGLKECTKCKSLMPFNRFWKDKDRNGGYNHRCIECSLPSCRKRLKDNHDRYNKNRRLKNESPSDYKKSTELVISDGAILDKEWSEVFGYDILSVKCKNCGKHHIPSLYSVNNRIRCINGTVKGEGNFYCSVECKNSCPIYGFITTSQTDPRSKQYTPSSAQQTTRKCQTNNLKQLQCDKHGYNYCEKCGDIIDVELHHTLTVVEHGTDAVSSAGHILLCAGCHTDVHRGCK